jgi:hypothetical protein
MSDNGLADGLAALLKGVTKNDLLLGVLDGVLKNQFLMEIVGGVYKSSLVQGVLQALLQPLVPCLLETLLPPKTVEALLERLDLPENDEMMERLVRILVLALNNLAPSEGVI